MTVLVSNGYFPCVIEVAVGYMLLPLGCVGSAMLVRRYLTNYKSRVRSLFRKLAGKAVQ